jgi:hypothetical protein
MLHNFRAYPRRTIRFIRSLFTRKQKCAQEETTPKSNPFNVSPKLQPRMIDVLRKSARWTESDMFRVSYTSDMDVSAHVTPMLSSTAENINMFSFRTCSAVNDNINMNVYSDENSSDQAASSSTPFLRQMSVGHEGAHASTFSRLCTDSSPQRSFTDSNATNSPMFGNTILMPYSQTMHAEAASCAGIAQRNHSVLMRSSSPTLKNSPWSSSSGWSPNRTSPVVEQERINSSSSSSSITPWRRTLSKALMQTDFLNQHAQHRDDNGIQMSTRRRPPQLDGFARRTASSPGKFASRLRSSPLSLRFGFLGRERSNPDSISYVGKEKLQSPLCVPAVPTLADEEPPQENGHTSNKSINTVGVSNGENSDKTSAHKPGLADVSHGQSATAPRQHHAQQLDSVSVSNVPSMAACSAALEGVAAPARLGDACEENLYTGECGDLVGAGVFADEERGGGSHQKIRRIDPDCGEVDGGGTRNSLASGHQSSQVCDSSRAVCRGCAAMGTPHQTAADANKHTEVACACHQNDMENTVPTADGNNSSAASTMLIQDSKSKISYYSAFIMKPPGHRFDAPLGQRILYDSPTIPQQQNNMFSNNPSPFSSSAVGPLNACLTPSPGLPPKPPRGSNDSSPHAPNPELSQEGGPIKHEVAESLVSMSGSSTGGFMSDSNPLKRRPECQHRAHDGIRRANSSPSWTFAHLSTRQRAENMHRASRLGIDTLHSAAESSRSRAALGEQASTTASPGDGTPQAVPEDMGEADTDLVTMSGMSALRYKRRSETDIRTPSKFSIANMRPRRSVSFGVEAQSITLPREGGGSNEQGTILEQIHEKHARESPGPSFEAIGHTSHGHDEPGESDDALQGAPSQHGLQAQHHDDNAATDSCGRRLSDGQNRNSDSRELEYDSVESGTSSPRQVRNKRRALLQRTWSITSSTRSCSYMTGSNPIASNTNDPMLGAEHSLGMLELFLKQYLNTTLGIGGFMNRRMKKLK